jgi:hypothetical protein
MTIPSILLGLLIALLIGALYHLIRNGGTEHLIIYLTTSVAGFVVGHLVGIWRGWVIIPIGPLNLGMEIIGALLILGITDWLIHLPARSSEDI